MATMTAQGTLPVAGADMNAEPITDTTNSIMTTYNGNNADEANVDYTSSDGVMVLGQAQANISAPKTFQDDVELRFGTGTDYWWVYDATNTKFDLYSTDVDGAGTNGIVISVNDGTPDLTFTGSFVLAAGENITFGTGETIGGDNTDLTVTSGGAINLTATTDVVVPANVGVTFGSGEKIEGDNTDLTVTSGADINLIATADINVPANVGMTFGNDAEKIEGDGTDLTISGNNINLTAVGDVVVPANVGITFGTGEKIEGDNTDLTVTSGADINLTATGDVNIPANIGVTFGDDGEKIEGDGTDLTISGNIINLAPASSVVVAGDLSATDLDGILGSNSAAAATVTTLSASGAVSFLGSAGSILTTVGQNGGGSTNQYFQLVSEQYDAAETEGFQIMETFSNGTNNQIVIGGGSADYNAANLIYFYTGANDATRTGTSRMVIDGSGNVGIGAGTPAVNLTVEISDSNTGAIAASAGQYALQLANTDGTNDTWSLITFSNEASSGTPSVAIGAQFTDTGNDYGDIVIGGRSAGGWGERMRVTGAGMVGINDTANTNMTVGLTINQGANDDTIFDVKSSDVAHGMTDWAETDTYGLINKRQAASGGMRLVGLSDANGAAGYALDLNGFLGEAVDTTKSTGGIGCIHLNAAVKNGTSVAACGADGNLVVITNEGTTRFIFDTEGTGHADVAWAAFDAEDDFALIHDVEATLVPDVFGEAVKYKEDDLVRLGLFGKGSIRQEPGGKMRGMMNWTKMLMLHHGTLNKVPALIEAKLQDAYDEIEQLKNRLQLIGA